MNGTNSSGPADQSDAEGVYAPPELLPEPLPEDPMPILGRWLREAIAASKEPNPNAMTLATVDADGTISARIVLCKDLDEVDGRVTFYTNYTGRKARALDANPRAALVFHWDHVDRQVRIEGPVTKSPPEESDEYFASRPWESKAGAWASDQSQPIGSRAEMVAQAESRLRQFGLDPAQLEPRDRTVQIPRPPHWGGYRIWARRVELWLGGPGRIHDRATWTRELLPAGDQGDGVFRSYRASGWDRQRLQP
ncbi:MAG: pyridoxamine 5'-phosphate oxidase [Planctomycetota bacterium]